MLCRVTAVANRSRRQPVSRGNRHAAAGESELDALTPERTLLPPLWESRLVPAGVFAMSLNVVGCRTLFLTFRVQMFKHAVFCAALSVSANAATYVAPVVAGTVNDRAYVTSIALRNDGDAEVRCESVHAFLDGPRGGTLRATYVLPARTTQIDEGTLREIDALGTLSFECTNPVRIAARIQTSTDGRTFDEGRFFRGVGERNLISATSPQTVDTSADLLLMEVLGQGVQVHARIKDTKGALLEERVFDIRPFAQQIVNLFGLREAAARIEITLTGKGALIAEAEGHVEARSLFPARAAAASVARKSVNPLDGFPAAFKAAPFQEEATGLIYMRDRWYDPRTGTFLTPDSHGYADSANPYAYCGGDPVNCSDPTGEIGLRAALTDGIISEYEMSTLELTDEEIRTVIGSQNALTFAGPDDPQAAKHNLARAKFILLARNPAFKAYAGELYQLTRGLNPLHFAAEVGWSIGAGEEPIMQQKINRRDKVLELATYLAFLKGTQWISNRLATVRSRALGNDGWESTHTPMQDRLKPHEKRLLGERWSREAILARGGTILGEEVDLVFNIGGRRVQVRADFVATEPDASISYVEAKFSPNASYQTNQAIVYPEIVNAGDAGLIAEVGARTGGGQLIRGQKLRVRFVGDVWNGAGTLHGQ